MSKSHDEILAQFQDFTGIDAGRALVVLENYGWDLAMAVNHAMDNVIDPDNGNGNGNTKDNNDDSDIQIIESFSPYNPQRPSTSRVTKKVETTPKIITFFINYNGKVLTYNLPESSTVGQLKRMIYSEVGITSANQILEGWPDTIITDNTALSTIKLSRNVRLNLCKLLTTKVVPCSKTDTYMREKPTETLYTLKIVDERKPKTYEIKYLGNTTVQKVKNDMYDLTDITVGNQVWGGWPDNYSNDSTLDQLHLSYPEHRLTIRSRFYQSDNSITAPGSSKPTESDVTKRKATTVHAIDSDDSEDYDYLISNDESPFCSKKNNEPLIPDDVQDEILGCMHFSEQFVNRYGPIHPNFYIGTLESAIKEACSKPVKERKILAMYLHHDHSVLSNVFCSHLLGCDAVLQMLEENFVVWGWDVTFESNRNLVINSISERLGSAGFATIRTMSINRFPVVILIMQNRSSTEIHTVIYGDVSINELSSRLIEAVDVFSSYQNKELRDEEERMAREMVKMEQDIAYNESLQNDRAKEEAKTKEAALEIQKQRQLAQELAEKQRKIEDDKRQARSRLTAEPDAQSSDVITIKIKTPQNEHLERRFYFSSPLNCLFDYLTLNGFPCADYKVLLTWPKRDLTLFDLNKSFEELQLHRQESVILEER